MTNREKYKQAFSAIRASDNFFFGGRKNGKNSKTASV